MLHRCLCFLVLALSLTLPAQAAPPSAGAAHRLLEESSGPVNPRYLLIGPQGQAVTQEDFRGRFQLISFGYTYCPDVCPTTLVDMAAILKQLGDAATQLQAIFISVDPERDTPAVLKTYTEFFDPRILGLTGTPELVSRAAQNYKVRYARVYPADGDRSHYSVDHSAGMFLLGPQGELLRKFPYGKPAHEIADDIAEFIAQTPPVRR